MAGGNAIRAQGARIPLEIRFWAKVDKSAGLDGCWPWTGAKAGKKSRSGSRYGFIRRGGGVCRTVLATHVSWELAHGPVPEGMWLLHRCDNPPCVNPAHLFLGSNQDNVNDMRSKGLHPRGETAGSSKLLTSDILAIRRLYEDGFLQREIAEQFGLTQCHVSKIVLRQTWQHIEG